MNSQENDFQALRALLRDLATRVERLERIIEPSGPSTEQMQGKQTQSSPLTLAPPPALLPEPVVSPARPSPSISTTVPIHTPAIAVPRPEANLESRIGSHWLNRIGISAVLVGVSYFLKFAFDNNSNQVQPDEFPSDYWRVSPLLSGAKLSERVVTKYFPIRSRPWA